MVQPFALDRRELLSQLDDATRSLEAVPGALSKGQVASAIRHVVNAIQSCHDVLRAVVLATPAGAP